MQTRNLHPQKSQGGGGGGGGLEFFLTLTHLGVKVHRDEVSLFVSYQEWLVEIGAGYSVHRLHPLRIDLLLKSVYV